MCGASAGQDAEVVAAPPPRSRTGRLIPGGGLAPPLGGGLKLGLAELGHLHLRHVTMRGGVELPQPFWRQALLLGTPGLGQILVRRGLRMPAGIPRSLHGPGGPHRKVAALAGARLAALNSRSRACSRM